MNLPGLNRTELEYIDRQASEMGLDSNEMVAAIVLHFLFCPTVDPADLVAERREGRAPWAREAYR